MYMSSFNSIHLNWSNKSKHQQHQVFTNLRHIDHSLPLYSNPFLRIQPGMMSYLPKSFDHFWRRGFPRYKKEKPLLFIYKVINVEITKHKICVFLDFHFYSDIIFFPNFVFPYEYPSIDYGIFQKFKKYQIKKGKVSISS